MENQEIKEANRKAMPMFTIVVFVPLILSHYYMKTKKCFCHGMVKMKKYQMA